MVVLSVDYFSKGKPQPQKGQDVDALDWGQTGGATLVSLLTNPNIETSETTIWSTLDLRGKKKSVPDLFEVVYFSRGALPQKRNGKRALLGGPRLPFKDGRRWSHEVDQGRLFPGFELVILQP